MELMGLGREEGGAICFFTKSVITKRASSRDCLYPSLLADDPSAHPCRALMEGETLDEG